MVVCYSTGMLFYTELQQSYIWLPLIGFTIGALGTMLGSGGGFFFPIILILFFNVPAQIAVATSLAASVPLSLVGTTGHYRKGQIHFRMATIFLAGGIAGAVAGTALTRLLSPETLKTTFGCYAIGLALLILRSGINSSRHYNRQENTEPFVDNGRRTISGVAYGFAGGAVSGTFGTGGAAPVLAGLLALKLPVRLIAGTSLMVVMVNTISALLGHSLIGHVDLTLVLLLTMGSVLGAWTGASWLAKLQPEKWENQIKFVFAFIIFASGIMLIL